MRLLYRVTVADARGRVTRRTRLRRSRSFVYAFLRWFNTHAVGAIKSCPDITNTSRNIPATALSAWQGGAGDTTRGNVVGTGTTVPGNTDYELATPIAHGTGAGQLSYQGQTTLDAAVVGANVDLTMQRAMINNSGASITVNEIGIHFQDANPYTYLAVRDKLAAGVAVPAGSTITVQYTWRTTA